MSDEKAPTLRQALEPFALAADLWDNAKDTDGVVSPCLLVKHLRTARAALAAEEESGWRPISEAKKDRTPIWAAIRADLVAFTGRDDLERWAGRQLCIHHPGLCADSFDIGWVVSAPVGHGGFPDSWIAGWQPLPPAPKASP